MFSLLAQIGISFDGNPIGKAFAIVAVFAFLWAAVAVLTLVGLFWASAAVARRRFELRELLAFISYWAVVFSFAARILHSN